MSISKRTLEKWRREALDGVNYYKSLPDGKTKFELKFIFDLCYALKETTQDLLDQHLMNKE